MTWDYAQLAADRGRMKSSDPLANPRFASPGATSTSMRSSRSGGGDARPGDTGHKLVSTGLVPVMIPCMAGAIGAAVLIFVGVLALAWWMGGRRSWRQSGSQADTYLSREMIRRHRVRPAELAVVERAANWGRESPDDRLRAATVDLAERQVRATGGRRRPPLWLVVLFASWGAFMVAFLVFEASRGRWVVPTWLNLAYWLALCVVGWRWQTGPERAIRLNSSRSSAARP
jgi:hypothetical protein